MSIAEFGALGEVLQGLATILVLITATVAVRQMRISATTDLFHRFNDPKARNHRRQVYHLCKRLTEDRENLYTLEKEAVIFEHLESVCNSLDWAGLLVRRGLLNKKDAIDLYGDSLIRSWVILSPWIDYTRKRRRSSPSWLWYNFEWLQGEAVKDVRFRSWEHEGVPVYTPSAIIIIDYKTSRVKIEDKIA